MPNPVSMAWKEEVNRRVAAHRSRKNGEVADQGAAPETSIAASSRAAQAMARVTARYANAPSYSQVLAEEARVAVRAAEAASRAAQQAHAAVQSVLAGLEAQVANDTKRAVEAAQVERPQLERPKLVGRKPVVESPWLIALPQAAVEGPQEAKVSPPLLEEFLPEQTLPEPALCVAEQTPPPVQIMLAPVAVAEPLPAPVVYDPGELAIRWEPALPERPQAPVATPEPDLFQAAVQDWNDVREALESAANGVIEPALPIHANLIEFPRELVATRRVRPRLIEGPLAAESESEQMSIFEVDPATVATEVAEACQPAAEAAWPSIQLDEQPEEELLAEEELRGEARPIEAVSADWRVMATVVNFSLVLGATLAASLAAASYTEQLPSLRMVEVGSILAFIAIALLYSLLFNVLAGGTPGMRYAQLRLITFEGSRPGRMRRLARLAAMLLSIAPAGLGLVWMIFDEDHLCWHDRLTRTYLRRY
ncbi:RDD family protein [Telmatobacter bradus]|uniref:RDD family protein n=1 Tax=Telmatobacter bradus TaxID=474953 RepID=UPI003B43694B